MGRLRFPLLVVVLGVVGAGAGLALASTPEPEQPEIEASAERIDCASAPETTAADLRGVKSCWEVELETAPAPQVTEQGIAEAKSDALCEEIASVTTPPDFCLQEVAQ
jgi:hypothetical protein